MKNYQEQVIKDELYDYLKKKFGAENVQESYLRMEAVISNTVSKIDFELKDTSVTALECEKRLLREDAFIAIRAKYGVYERNATDADGAIKFMQTQPNDVAFTTDATNAFLKTHLKRVWNGDLVINKGGQDQYEAYPTSRFLEKSVTQQSASTNSSSGLGGDEGSVMLTPRLALYGDQQTKISFVPKPIATAKWANIAPLQNVLVLEFHGFVIKGQGKSKDLFNAEPVV